MKRKSRGLTQRLQRPRRRAAPPVPDQVDEMDDLYDNTRFKMQIIKPYFIEQLKALFFRFFLNTKIFTMYMQARSL